MKKSTTIAFLVVVLAAISAVRPLSASAPTLTGKMSQLQYLVGAWSCVNKMSAMDNSPAFTHPSTISYKVLLRNTIGYNSSSTGFFYSGFYGYANAKQKFWVSAADNQGGVFLASGTGGAGFTLTGSSTDGSESNPQRIMLTKLSDSKYEDRVDLKEGSKWMPAVVTTCTKI